MNIFLNKSFAAEDNYFINIFYPIESSLNRLAYETRFNKRQYDEFFICLRPFFTELKKDPFCCHKMLSQFYLHTNVRHSFNTLLEWNSNSSLF